MGNTWTHWNGCRGNNPEVANVEQTAILKQRTRSNSFPSQEVLQESNLQLCEVEANRDLIQEKQDGNTSKDSGELRTFSEPEDASPSHSPVEMSSRWGQAEMQQALTDGEEGEQERTAAAGDHLLHEDKKGVMEKRSEAERSSGSEPSVTALVNTKRSRLSNKEQGILEGQSIFQWRTSKPTGPSASAEETQKKDTAMINLTRHEKEKYIPSDELSSASAAGDQKEKPALETRKERARTSHGKASQAHDLKAFLINQDAHKNCQVKLSVSSSSSAMELSADNEEDMYRDAEEIEREKVLPVCETGFSENKLSVAAEMDIIEYCQKEWRGSTPMAKLMKKTCFRQCQCTLLYADLPMSFNSAMGYEAVSQKFTSIRRVRGDNYCALRATLFQALSQASELPDWLQSEDLTLLPEKLLSKYDWIKQWQLRQKLGRRMGELSNEIKDSLILLRKKWEIMSEMKTPVERQAACDELFTNEEEEYSLYEAVKFLMLNTAIELYDDDKKGKKVPVFSWLLFARDTSSNPSQLMNNHLNQIGHTGGLEQVEMFLLAYALQYTIRVYRLYKYSTDEFITLYPNDPEEDWPMVTLLTEDDRHYNIPVRMCEETSL